MNARWMILGLLVAGCSETVEEAHEVATHSCPPGTERVVGNDGHFAWCATSEGRVATGPWMSYHEPPSEAGPGAPASEGDFRDGQMRGPWRSWWPNGTPAASLDVSEGAGTMVLFEERGLEVARLPYQDGLPVLCAEASAHKDLPRAVEARCGDDHSKSGFVRTAHADGSRESETFTWKGEPHGRMLAFHRDGKPWLMGEHLMGKRHGPWIYWNADGTPKSDGELPALD